jgi:hypothetical protein
MQGAIAALSGRTRATLTDAELLAPLMAGASELKACLALAPEPGRVAFMTPILHTFVRPDGTATGARLEPFVGEGVERCVGETLRLMRWPPFSGERRELVVPLSLTPDPPR